MRQLWLLVACAVIWLSAGTAHAQRAPQDTIVFVASETARPPIRGKYAAKPAKVVSAPSRPGKWLARRIEPNHETRQAGFIQDRYLRHCALLL